MTELESTFATYLQTALAGTNVDFEMVQIEEHS